MKLKPFLCFFFAFLIASPLPASDWWEKKPYTEWSERDTYRILHNSPWVALSSVGFVRQEIGIHGVVQMLPWNYRVRLLSSKVVRQAFLRRISFNDDPFSEPCLERTISVSDLRKETEAASQYMQMERFITTNPDDIRSRGDDRFIVISVSYTTDPFIRAEDGRPNEFFGFHPAELLDKTFLSTKTGKRIPLSRYEFPGPDNLGAKFYFPRKMPDGTPAICPDDEEMKFETEITGIRISVKFNLKRLMYEGDLAI